MSELNDPEASEAAQSTFVACSFGRQSLGCGYLLFESKGLVREMARNEEKAQSMLSRYLRTKKDGGESGRKRPYLATLCDDVDEAEKWRQQILGDIRRRVSEIQNPGLDDVQLRELNDSINKLLRERKHWERRILFLGGKDHERARKRGKGHEIDNSKEAVFEHNGYFYFGAARNLPGVQELIERQDGTKKELERSREESSAVLYRRVDIEYYGYLDDRDGSLQEIEREAEQVQKSNLGRQWEQSNEGRADEPWDSSYLDFVGKKPPSSTGLDVQDLILERKKAEALEQLQAGAMKQT